MLSHWLSCPELRWGHQHKLALPQPSIGTTASPPALEPLPQSSTAQWHLHASPTSKARRQGHVPPTRMDEVLLHCLQTMLGQSFVTVLLGPSVAPQLQLSVKVATSGIRISYFVTYFPHSHIFFSYLPCACNTAVCTKTKECNSSLNLCASSSSSTKTFKQAINFSPSVPLLVMVICSRNCLLLLKSQ